jgi:AraC family transcriptional regulator
MQSSAYPVVVAEEDYAGALTLRSGVDERTALTVSRTRINVANPDIGLGFGYRPGYVVRLHLQGHGGSKIAHGKARLEVPPRRVAESSFRRISEPAYWPIAFPIDQLRFELPEAALAHWMEDHHWARTAQLDLRSGSSIMDNALLSFGRAAIMSLDEPERASQFFIDHILTGVCSYLFENFCDHSRRILPGGLAPWQKRRAKDLIEARLGSDLSLSELAAECGLSVAQFSRAFRQSIGQTPHRWLMQRRIDAARRLLVGTDKPLVQIAADCGFSDQAHFTNIFTRMVGTSPGAFRRQQLILIRVSTPPSFQ